MIKQINKNAASQAMEVKGISQANVASSLSVSREAVSKWLRGTSFPRPDKLLKLALLLDMKLNELVVRDVGRDPVVAFRKRGANKTTEQHIQRAKEMGRLLTFLVPYLPFDRFMKPATLKNPVNSYEYVQDLAGQIRANLGIASNDPLGFPHLVKQFRDLQTVIVPVLWGKRDRHMNAVHIFLPESMTTWVYLNLDTEFHDFMFWMAHELGHVLSPGLLGEDGEDFADSFAGALLFPGSIARDLYTILRQAKADGQRVNIIKGAAEECQISPITVYRETNRYAGCEGLPEIDLEKSIYGAAANLNKAYHTVSETLLSNNAPPRADEYVAATEEIFESKFFEVLRSYLRAENKGAGYIQEILDISLLDAKEIFDELLG